MVKTLFDQDRRYLLSSKNAILILAKKSSLGRYKKYKNVPKRNCSVLNRNNSPQIILKIVS